MWGEAQITWAVSVFSAPCKAAEAAFLLPGPMVVEGAMVGPKRDRGVNNGVVPRACRFHTYRAVEPSAF